MGFEPIVAFARSSVYGSFDVSEIGRSLLAWPIAPPDVSPIELNLVMEGVVNSDVEAGD